MAVQRLKFMDYTDEQIVKMYENLPDDLRAAIFGVNTSKIVEDIGRKHNLAIDKIGDLGNETGMVMLGVTHPNDFITNLSERLEVDKAKAKEIAEDINVNVFKKVRESLKKIHGIPPEGVPKELPLENSQGESLGRIESREEILREIERSEIPPVPKIEPPVPDILKGSTTLAEEKKEGEKKKEEIPPAAPPAQKYQSGADPYREKIE